jgi:hypothetical protein
MVKKPTLILLGLFVLLGVYAWLNQKSSSGVNKNTTATPTSISSPLADWKFDNTRLVKYENPNGKAISLRMGKDITSWSVDQSADTLVDAGKVMQLFSELQGIQPIAKLDPPSDEEVMGLGANSQTLTLVDSSGATKEIRFGKKTATASGSYIKVGDSVYIVDTPVLENVTGLLTLEGIVKSTELPAPAAVTPQP